jgi:hypothetical protein
MARSIASMRLGSLFLTLLARVLTGQHMIRFRTRKGQKRCRTINLTEIYLQIP